MIKSKLCVWKGNGLLARKARMVVRSAYSEFSYSFALTFNFFCFCDVVLLYLKNPLLNIRLCKHTYCMLYTLILIYQFTSTKENNVTYLVYSLNITVTIFLADFKSVRSWLACVTSAVDTSSLQVKQASTSKAEGKKASQQNKQICLLKYSWQGPSDKVKILNSD